MDVAYALKRQQRIIGLIFEETRGVIKLFHEHVVRDAASFIEVVKRKTVTIMDVVYALKRRRRIHLNTIGNVVSYTEQNKSKTIKAMDGKEEENRSLVQVDLPFSEDLHHSSVDDSSTLLN